MNDRPNDNNLAEWMQKVIPLQNADDQAQSLLNETEQALGALYQQAESAGDADAMNSIMVTWTNAQKKREVIRQQNAALTGAAAVMGNLARQRNDTLKELNSLVAAIASGDTSDERLFSIIEAAAEEFETLDEEEHFNQFYDEVRGNVSASAQIHPAALKKFIHFLQGRVPLNSVQEGLFKAFVHALSMHVEEAARV